MPIRTEKEKMLAGEIYNCLDPDLVAERQTTKALLRLYNLTEAAPTGARCEKSRLVMGKASRVENARQVKTQLARPCGNKISYPCNS